MPEAPEDEVFLEVIEKTKHEDERCLKEPFQASLQIFPSAFAEGTPKRDYTTATADCSLFDPSLEPIPEAYSPRRWDATKAATSKYAPIRHLLRPTTPGSLHAVIRGKLMAIACGHHCMTIHWGLEAQLIVVTVEQLQELITCDTPGPNLDRKKAQRLRSFRVPEHFRELHSNPSTKDRLLTVMAAFVGVKHAFLIVDHSRLVRFHIQSRNEVWTAEDLSPNSKTWEGLWSCFNGGPDWLYELPQALQELDRWRQLNLDDSSCHGISILQAMSTADDAEGRFFASFGRHTINDALHHVELHPGMPAAEICADDTLYEAFKAGLAEYMQQFRSAKFRRLVCNRPNTSNPFTFQASLDARYSATYMTVFRKATVRISIPKYNRMLSLGLFDPEHTIGEPYIAKPEHIVTDLDRQYIEAPVLHLTDSLDTYTIIRAKIPTRPGWAAGTVKPAKDHRLDGYKTTIGPANFMATKSNKLNASAALEAVKGKPGRKPKVKNAPGMAGRPRKIPTVAALEKLAQSEERIQQRADATWERWDKRFGPLICPPASGKENAAAPEEAGTISSRTRSNKRSSEDAGSLSLIDVSNILSSKRRRTN
ncbi:hypothetical protein BDZ89DRAFT_1057739 [Hymenopellis radicata]|nr:hypothetical protein BDZ89DRAFT_1057739 [Hymenopellis radicata]